LAKVGICQGIIKRISRANQASGNSSGVPFGIQSIDAPDCARMTTAGDREVHIACDPKVHGFSAAAKSSKNPRRIGIHSVFLLQDKKCCVDRLNRQE
jgi:hypothetical protein